VGGAFQNPYGLITETVTGWRNANLLQISLLASTLNYLVKYTEEALEQQF
jgi:hypothetical protein